jgi:peroxiredoxin Q/BCP
MLTGKKAPAFALPDQNGNTVSLGELAGQWAVLYFYPRDDTPGCTVEACEFTRALPDFRGLGARVLGCSADGRAAHAKFIGKHRLGIDLLTDADHAVMRAYGAFGEKVLYGRSFEGIIRSTVLIAPDGTVAHHWAKVRAEGHAEQVRQRLQELRSGADGAAAPLGKAKPNGKAKIARPAPRPQTGRAAAAKPAGGRKRKVAVRAASKRGRAR